MSGGEEQDGGRAGGKKRREGRDGGGVPVPLRRRGVTQVSHKSASILSLAVSLRQSLFLLPLRRPLRNPASHRLCTHAALYSSDLVGLPALICTERGSSKNVKKMATKSRRCGGSRWV